MGLCKCPKRRVTNQFCFEHCVNVCENCMVTNHPRCIVQSYLQWLQDGDFNPICELCNKNLGTEDCIRLTCYHIYHWWCLDGWARNLPPNTAPAGYTCPSCSTPLFPAKNLISPVADVLKEKLAGVNWARIGLGLPLLSEEVTVSMPSNDAPGSPTSTKEHSIINVIDAVENNAFSRATVGLDASTKRAVSLRHESHSLLFDRDEDKYKRRSWGEWLSRRYRNFFTPSGRKKLLGKPVILILIIIIVVILLIGFMGRMTNNDDPAFDVRNNPQIMQEN